MCGAFALTAHQFLAWPDNNGVEVETEALMSFPPSYKPYYVALMLVLRLCIMYLATFASKNFQKIALLFRYVCIITTTTGRRLVLLLTLRTCDRGDRGTVGHGALVGQRNI